MEGHKDTPTQPRTLLTEPDYLVAMRLHCKHYRSIVLQVWLAWYNQQATKKR